MQPENLRRRTILKMSALALGATALPFRYTFGATGNVRLEWQAFKTSKWYTPFIKAVGQMKANRKQSDKNSWLYWVNVHKNYCPHGVSYFLAWHRGYLSYFEQQLRSITGMNDFVLPYWNYYQYAQMPAEFTDPASGNPLYVSNRQSTNVVNALTMAPFASNIINFPRGMNYAYEPSFEDQPHNPIHNLIGGVMATMSSPTDPIFYLHHANVDRLWLAWVMAGAGRQMPNQTESYWSGTFTYAGGLTMQRSYTYDTLTKPGYVGYDYSNDSLPSSLPLARKDESGLVRVQASPNAPALPPVVSAQASAAGSIGGNAYSLGGVLNVALDARSISVQLPVAAVNSRALQAIAANAPASVPGSTLQFNSAQIVLDGLQLTGQGAQGGYFYYVYLNLPASGDFAAQKEKYLIGTLGPFEIDSAQHHDGVAVRRYPITDKLAGLDTPQLSLLTVSFIRVNGDKAPTDQVIGIGEVRVELST